MNNHPPILLLSDYTQTVEFAESALHGQYGPVEFCHDMFDLSQALDHNTVAMVLVDLDPHPMRVLNDLESLTNQYPRSRFIALADHVTPEIIARAMEVGVRQCLPKATNTDLQGAVRRLMPSAGGVAPTTGNAVTILSAGGGCGSTTLAVNLANELQISGAKPALVVDLDTAYGAVAVYLGLKGQFGVADILSQEGHIDSELIRTTAMHYSDGLHALLSPASVDYSKPRTLDWSRLDRMMDVCKQEYRWVVLDAPRVPVDIAAEMAKSSRFTFIVGQISVKDIRCARDIANALMSHDVRPNTIRYVAGRYTKGRRMLTLEQAERALGNAKVDLIHNDFSSAIESINLGQTLEQSAPRSVLRHDVQVLAETLTNPSRPANALVESR